MNTEIEDVANLEDLKPLDSLIGEVEYEESPVSPIETEEPGTSDALEFQDDEGLTYKCNYLSVCANVSANKILRRFEAIWKLTNYT